MSVIVAGSFLMLAILFGRGDTGGSHPSFSSRVARMHELQPHRQTVPEAAVPSGLHELRLRLTIAADGRVTDAEPYGDAAVPWFWPALRDEVLAWRFTPFERNGKPVTAEVEESIALAPPEQLPKRHVTPPPLSAASRIAINLQRSGCFGACPAYTVSTDAAKVSFEGRAFVVAQGVHTGSVRIEEVRRLAKRFIDADFYSMNDEYRWAVTDIPTYFLSITIDGQQKYATDYAGIAVGMPGVITDLEAEVDRVTGTQRWIEGGDGLVAQLREERFDFTTTAAQHILKEATTRGETGTVKELLAAGVPITSFPRSQPANQFRDVGWLNAASKHPDILKTFINAGASRNDQTDKDLALEKAARSGSIAALKALIGYGANPNADFRRLLPGTSVTGTAVEGLGAGTVLIAGASSGNPEVVQEILKYHPNLEVRDREGRTPTFSAVEHRESDQDGATRVTVVRLLSAAGANVNARDTDGNTPLHRAFLPEVAAELLKLGANINAQNHKRETPIFVTPSDENISLFLQHGADLSLQDVAGETVAEVAKKQGSSRQAALAKAIEEYGRRQGASLMSHLPGEADTTLRLDHPNQLNSKVSGECPELSDRVYLCSNSRVLPVLASGSPVYMERRLRRYISKYR